MVSNENASVLLVECLQEFVLKAEAELGKSFPAAVVAAGQVYGQLGLVPEEARGLFPGLLAEVKRGLPDFLVGAALIAALPHLAGQFRRRSERDPRVAGADMADLSHDTVVKVLRALRGSRPRGNVAAWLNTVHKNVYRDHLRKRTRQERGMERLEEAARAMRS